MADERRSAEPLTAESFRLMQTPPAAETASGRPRGRLADSLSRLKHNKAAVISFWLILLITLMALLGPGMTPYGYRDQLVKEELVNMPPRIRGLTWLPLFNGHTTVRDRKVSALNDPGKYPPGSVVRIFNERTVRGEQVADAELDAYVYHGADDSVNFWFGTDSLGRDLWTRVWRGTRISLMIAAFSVLTDLLIGTLIGAVSGYYGGTADLLLMRLCDIVGAIPNVVVCTLMILMMGSGVTTMIIAMAARNWVGSARLMRTQFLRFRDREYVLAAKTMGVPDRKLILRHILPNAAGPMITRAVLAVPGAIFTEAFLSYIGLGVPAPEPSLGTLLSSAQEVLTLYPTQTLFPALVLLVLMIAFNLLANGLRDALDPSLRGEDQERGKRTFRSKVSQ